VFYHHGPGPGPQQPPDTPRNPKLTARHAFTYAGPNSLDIFTTEGVPRPEPSRLILYDHNTCLLTLIRAVVLQDESAKLHLACWRRSRQQLHLL
jgi:hypothetical protein